MAEIGKKAKSPAKPRKDAAAKDTSLGAKASSPSHEKIAQLTEKYQKDAANKDKSMDMKATSPSREQIAQLAEKYWAERGYQDGHAEQDWLRAEQELHHNV